MRIVLRIFSVFLCFIFLSSEVAFGLGGISNSDIRKAMNRSEERYGFDQNILRRAKQKQDAPTAEIYFDNTSPKEGELVTATAYGMNFKNNLEELYYTWYILHVNQEDMICIKEDGESEVVKAGEGYVDSRGNCLAEEDAIEEGKREAMGMIARGSFDPVLFGVTYKEVNYSKEIGEGSAYRAPVGGANGVGAKIFDLGDDDLEDLEKDDPALNLGIGTYENKNYQDEKRQIVDGNKITRCYRHNFGDKEGGTGFGALNAGKDLIVECKHKFPTAKKGELIYDASTYDENGNVRDANYTCKDNYEIGDGDFSIEEKACWGLNPATSDTDGDGVPDEADLAGLGQKEFSWRYKTGDRVGVIIEGTSVVPINEGQSNVTERALANEPFEWTGEYIYFGGGYIKPDVVDRLEVAILAGEDIDEIIKIINEEGHEPVTIGGTITVYNEETKKNEKVGGLLTIEEFVEMYNRGLSITSERNRISCLTDSDFWEDNEETCRILTSNFFEKFEDKDISNDLTLTGLIDLEVLFEELTEFYRLSGEDLHGLIFNLEDDIIEDIAIHLSGEPNPDVEEVLGCSCGSKLWPPIKEITDLYDSNGTITQEEVNAILIGDSGIDTVLVDDIIAFLEEENTVSRSEVQTAFDNSIVVRSGLEKEEGEEATEEAFNEAIINYFMQGELTSGYYKIMWAGLDICGREDEDYALNDECEEGKLLRDKVENKKLNFFNWDLVNNTEKGFTYLASKPVFEQAVTTLGTTLTVSPEEPIFIEKDEKDVDKEINYSDEIVVNAFFNEEAADKRFVHYEWGIYECEELNYEHCTEKISNSLTSSCSEGQSLGSCAKNSNGEAYFESTSPIKGTGLNEIRFKPTKVLMGDEIKRYFKITLKTKRSSEDTAEMALSTAPLVISKNDTNIEFYRIIDRFDVNGKFERSAKICDTGNYKMICPVYPYQVLVARIEDEEKEDVKINGYYWEFNGKKVEPVQGVGCPFSSDCFDPKQIHIPITNDFSGLKEVSLTIEKEKDGVSRKTTTTRKISVRNPVAKINSQNTDTAYLKTKDGEIISGVFYTNPSSSNEVTFSANVIPNYLGNDEVDFYWTLNNREVDEAFISKNSDLAIQTTDNLIKFLITENFGGVYFSGTSLGVRTEKVFSNDYVEMLYDAWGIKVRENKLTEDSLVSIKKDDNPGATEIGSLGLFFASTVKNVPEYLIFSLKLGVIMVLIWSALFGSSFFFEAYKRKEFN